MLEVKSSGIKGDPQRKWAQWGVGVGKPPWGLRVLKHVLSAWTHLPETRVFDRFPHSQSIA